MPEPDDLRLADLKLLGALLSVGGVVLLIGAALAWFTGAGDAPRGGRAHMDAFFVLGFLGVALLVPALVVAAEHKERRGR